MQSGKYCSPGNPQTQTHPSDCQTEKRDSLLQRTRLHCSRIHCSSIQRFAVVPSCFYFVITPLTVDRGIFFSKEISRMAFFALVATYNSTTLEFTELLRATYSFTNVCRSSLHA
ncbi:unnamed protein product [Staurois parvus]|uniref:Uncharacterized protein n=1 Tax=Staurois parvus TaxID=386267 RepID=A0ABN9GUP0_9NEOB|nr:unnamed protein product [Staurois parvus]